jgi:hypothetical protein
VLTASLPEVHLAAKESLAHLAILGGLAVKSLEAGAAHANEHLETAQLDNFWSRLYSSRSRFTR